MNFCSREFPSRFVLDFKIPRDALPMQFSMIDSYDLLMY